MDCVSGHQLSVCVRRGNFIVQVSTDLIMPKHLKVISEWGGIAAGWISQCQTTTPELRAQSKRLSLIQRQLIMDEGRHH